MKSILNKYNLQFNKNEISGSFGDMGMFLPLAAALASQCGMNLGHIFLISGLANIISGISFRIPIPVQPMKVIAAVAIAEGLTQETIIASGILMGLIMLILALAGLMDYLNRIIPRSVIRGLQFAVGLKLLIKGGEMAISSGYWVAIDSYLTALICLVVVTIFMYKKIRIGALVLFLVGIVLIFLRPGEDLILTFGCQLPTIHIPVMDNFIEAFWKLALPQIPLTILNAVVAVCVLSHDLCPENPMLPKKTAISNGLMNLLGCPLGGMPVCHGAGGLAAQYHFGARTGGSMVFLGLFKILVAVVLGGSLLMIISAYPSSVLGVLLLFAGLQLILVCKDMRKLYDIIPMIITLSGCLILGIAPGFLIGFIIAYLIHRLIPS